jgi:hypothetical protein
LAGSGVLCTVTIGRRMFFATCNFRHGMYFIRKSQQARAEKEEAKSNA